MSKTKGRAAPAVTEEQPQSGGSYVRRADGSLERVSGPDLAAPEIEETAAEQAEPISAAAGDAATEA